MNAIVVAYIIGALAGLALVLLAAETSLPQRIYRHWQSHNREVNADIAYLRGLPRTISQEDER